jgi:predicted dienelactone hydrolase
MSRPGLLLAALLAFATPALAEAPPSVPGVDAPELARLGPQAVGVRTVTWTQPAQPDVLAYDKAKAAAPLVERKLTVEIWYPAQPQPKAKPAVYADALSAEPPKPPVAFTVPGIAVRDAPGVTGSFPLVILSHGYGGASAGMSWLAENLASKGYVVVAPRHHDPEFGDAAGFPGPLMRRPIDIAFAAAQARAGARAGQPGLAAADPARTVLIGYSMGGYGVLTDAGASLDPKGSVNFVPGGLMAPYARGGPRAAELRVPDVKAVVAIAPAGISFNAWGADGLSGVTAPLLIIGGDRDRTVGFAGGIRPVFDRAIHADRYLLVFQNGGHAIGMNGAPPTMRNSVWDMDWFEDPVWRHDRIMAINQHMITAFLDAQVKGDASRLAYLTPDTPQSNDTKWPANGPPGYAPFSPGGPGATWKGFPKNHALGLELHHAAPAP